MKSHSVQPSGRSRSSRPLLNIFPSSWRLLKIPLVHATSNRDFRVGSLSPMQKDLDSRYSVVVNYNSPWALTCSTVRPARVGDRISPGTKSHLRRIQYMKSIRFLFCVFVLSLAGTVFAQSHEMSTVPAVTTEAEK